MVGHSRRASTGRRHRVMRMRTGKTARTLPSNVPAPLHDRLGPIELLSSLLKHLLVRSEDWSQRREPLVESDRSLHEMLELVLVNHRCEP